MKQKDIEILIQKYLNGETTPEEEKTLALEVSRDDAPQEWKIIAEMLGELTIDEALYDKMMAERSKKPRIIKFWPWLAAACVAALLIVFLAPPREEANRIAKADTPTIQKIDVKDSVQSEIIPQPTKEEMHIAQVAKKKTHSVRSKQEDLLSEPEQTYNDLAMVEESHPKSNDILPSPAEQRMEEFYAQAAYIQRHGQQLMHRVSMQNNNTYNINQTKDL